MDTILWGDESDAFTQRTLQSLKQQPYNRKEKEQYVQEMASCILSFIPKPHTFCDIGCSYGATIFYLRKFFPEAIFEGIDPGKESIRIAKENLEADNIHFRVGHSQYCPNNFRC